MKFLATWFAHPTVLFLWGVIPLLAVGALFYRRWQRRNLARLGQAPMTSMTTLPWWLRALRGGCLMGGYGILVAGIAGPQWGRERGQETSPGRDVVVVLDASRSMLAEDVLGRTSPNRLGRARDALLDLARVMRKRGGHRLALVAFAAQARVYCPLTHDYDHFEEAIKTVQADDPRLAPDPLDESTASGTRIGAALRLALEIHEPSFQGHQDILLLSDGDDPAGGEEWRLGAELARDQGVFVHVVGIGDRDRDSPIVSNDGPLLYRGKPVTTRLREQPLQQIAVVTRGTYTPAQTREIPLGELFRATIEPLEGREDAEDLLSQPAHKYPWFLATALGLLMMPMVMPEGRRNGVQ